MSHQPPRSIAPIVAGGAFAVMIVTFGLLIYGRSKSTQTSSSVAVSPSPSITSSSPVSPAPRISNSPSSVASPSRPETEPPPAAKIDPAPVPPPQSSQSAPATAMHQSATVIDPPSNVRDKPNGEILCSLPKRTTILLTGQQGDWYQTDVCGAIGYIHRSQIQLSAAAETQSGGVAQIIDPPSNIRSSPNGAILCQITTPEMIHISDRQGDWYKTDVCGEPGYIHKSQLKF